MFFTSVVLMVVVNRIQLLRLGLYGITHGINGLVSENRTFRATKLGTESLYYYRVSAHTRQLEYSAAC